MAEQYDKEQLNRFAGQVIEAKEPTTMNYDLYKQAAEALMGDIENAKTAQELDVSKNRFWNFENKARLSKNERFDPERQDRGEYDKASRLSDRDLAVEVERTGQGDDDRVHEAAVVAQQDRQAYQKELKARDDIAKKINELISDRTEELGIYDPIRDPDRSDHEAAVKEHTPDRDRGSDIAIRYDDGAEYMQRYAKEAQEKARQLAKEIGVRDEDIRVHFENTVSSFEYAKDDKFSKVGWFYNAHPEFDNLVPALGTGNWEATKQMVKELDEKEPEHEMIEGTDVREPGPAMQEVMAQEDREDREDLVKAEKEGKDYRDPDLNVDLSDKIIAETKAENAKDSKKKVQPEKTGREKRAELRDNIKRDKKELNALWERVGHETAVMVAQAGPGQKETKEKIDGLMARIRDTTIQKSEDQAKYRSQLSQDIKGVPVKAAKALGRKFTDLGKRIVRNGKEALAKAADHLHSVNQKAAVKGRSAYADVTHNITDIYRGWAHTNYSLEKTQAHVIDSLQKTLSKHYAKSAQRSVARKNIKESLKTLFTGKKHDLTQDIPPFTEKQMNTLSSLETMKQKINAEAEKDLALYNKSAVKDLSRMEKVQGERKTIGLRPHMNLQADIDRIHNQMKKDSQKRSKDPLSQTKSKETKIKDDDRIR